MLGAFTVNSYTCHHLGVVALFLILTAFALIPEPLQFLVISVCLLYAPKEIQSSPLTVYSSSASSILSPEAWINLISPISLTSPKSTCTHESAGVVSLSGLIYGFFAKCTYDCSLPSTILFNEPPLIPTFSLIEAVTW